MGTMKHYAMTIDGLMQEADGDIRDYLPDLTPSERLRVHDLIRGFAERAFQEGCAMVRRQAAGESTYWSGS